MTGQAGTFTATRAELAVALTRLDVRVLTSGPAAGMIDADMMAGAIIEALTPEPDPVHYRWPVACGDFTSGELWAGNLDRVTCAACRSSETAAPEADLMASEDRRSER